MIKDKIPVEYFILILILTFVLKMSYINTLPNDVLLHHILVRLEPRYLYILKNLYKNIQTILKDDDSWRILCNVRYPMLKHEIFKKDKFSYMSYYNGLDNCKIVPIYKYSKLLTYIPIKLKATGDDLKYLKQYLENIPSDIVVICPSITPNKKLLSKESL